MRFPEKSQSGNYSPPPAPGATMVAAEGLIAGAV